MSEEAIPQWAFRRADELMDAESGYRALARYIASKEEAPVDPIVAAGRRLVVETQHNWPDSPWHVNEAAETLAGQRDFTPVVKAAIEGVRRGMELAKEQSDAG